jgi:hypothetical protein
MATSRFRVALGARLASWSAVPWSLGVALGLLIFFTPHPEWHLDLELFREQNPILRYPAYAHWLFTLLGLVPEPVAYLGLSLASIGGLYLAVLAFEGAHWMVFTSFAFAWILFYGQLDGLVAAGLGLAWWALRKGRPILQGAGLILASLKPQLALPAMALLWWWSPSRFRSLWIPGAVLLVSFLTSGFWLPGWLGELQDVDHLVLLSRNLSFWPLVGWWIFLLWPLILALRLPRDRKLVAVLAGTALTSPYFPLPSAVILLALAVPWWTWGIAQLPLFSFALGGWIYSVGRILPVSLLLWAAWPALRAGMTRSPAKDRSRNDVQ